MKTWIARIYGFIGVLMLSGTAHASACTGKNLFNDMDPQRRAQLQQAVTDVPYGRGIFWRAEKGDQVITILGTYHFGDPRHQDALTRFGPDIRDAAGLWVEAGPDEEARLTRALTSDPSLMVSPDGPTLPERLSDADWQALSGALADRGFPAVIASRMRPWYVAMMMGISPCMMKQVQETGNKQGLDHLVIDLAQKADIPIHALEPWDTVFGLFSDLTPEEEVDMIRATLPAAEHADDYAVTLTEAYFAGDVWAIWEFGRFDAYDHSDLGTDQIDRQMEMTRVALMDNRNAAWITPLTQAAQKAAKQGKGIVAAFGALHLPGEQGVLRLLEQQGWTITELE